ncbi:MAG TPA: tetratricopeptide repeat protein, partial [Gemmatimonadota bacterium]|nr:tetratricopeptide repeat protein [Gemmatimonadota bacterium]
GSADAARTVFERIVALAPGHAQARAALERLAPEEAPPAADGAAEEPAGEASAEAPSAADARPRAGPDDGKAGASGPEAAAVPAGGEPGGRGMDDMLVGFRARQDAVSEDADAEARCEFGATLREMGRLEDAIREFQAAARMPDPPIRAFELLGECFVEQGLHGVAARVLTRALRQPGHREVDLLGVLYQLGVARQALGETEAALECYERVYSIDIDFRDVGDRMRACAL